MSEIGTVPSMVKTPFAHRSIPSTRINTERISTRRRPVLDRGDQEGAQRPNEIRTNFNATDRQTEGAGTNGVVRAQGEVRGAVGKAANDVVNALHVGKPGKAAEDGATASDQRGEEFRRHRQEGSQGGAAGREGRP